MKNYYNVDESKILNIFKFVIEKEFNMFEMHQYMDKLKSIENPIQFYNYVKQSNILSDLFLFYKDNATAQTYGGFKDNQEAFDTAIFEQLEIPRPKM